MIKHIKITNLPISTADCLKKTILPIISNLKSKNISIIGICTDNGPNLKSACDQIILDFKNGKIDVPLIRFACSAHTAQLLLKYIDNSSQFYYNIILQAKKIVKWLKKYEIRKYSHKVNLRNAPSYSEIRWN